MAPPKKSRSLNKQLSKINEVSPEKATSNSSRSNQRKKKLSDKLGSQWSKEELGRFYEAYRKYGRDWKKVASIIRNNRTIEMVEALYNMNKAYLSLPEGTASVVGLIAMMTDHYNVLEVSDSEEESIDVSVSRKPIKRKRGKALTSASQDNFLNSNGVSSSDGCLSLLKRRRFEGGQPRAVGKRTPRIPVSFSYKRDDWKNHFSHNKKGRNSEVTDDEVAHAAALALTEASKVSGSPHVGESPSKRTEHRKSSPMEGRERMRRQSGKSRAKFNDVSMDEDWLEGSRKRKGDGDRYCTKNTMDMEGGRTKGKKILGKKDKFETNRDGQLDDCGEACSGTEGLSSNSQKEKVEIKFSNAKYERSLHGQRKKSKKSFLQDESSALDALQALADLSLMMPDSTVEFESSALLKEDKATLDLENKSSIPEAASTSRYSEKVKLPGAKQEKVLDSISGFEGSTSNKSKLRGDILTDVTSSAKEQHHRSSRTLKRKAKSSVSKIMETKANIDSQQCEPLKTEVKSDEETKPVSGGQTSGLSNPSKSIRGSDSFLTSDLKRLRIDSAVSTSQIPESSEAILTAKQRCKNKCKVNQWRTFLPKEKTNKSKSHPNKHLTSLQDRTQKEKISSCMSCSLVHKWCKYEWFYSAIDYPWFAKREFAEYLDHVGLDVNPMLTSVEWDVLRSSLGKPRRLSEHFLREEREKLKDYRESVRKHYTELRTSVREGLPTDLARPLSVGQRVIAIHPETREVHDGSVLTVDHDRCRIQFDRPEIGVEFVKDIDCMPVNPFDNMPETLRHQKLLDLGRLSLKCKESQMNRDPNFGGCMTFASNGHLEKASNPSAVNTSLKKGDSNHVMSQVKGITVDMISGQQSTVKQPYIAHQAREADIRVLDEKVSSTMLNLKQPNTYHGNVLRPWLNPPASSSVLVGGPCSFENQESVSCVVEIVKGSRLKAQMMVTAAIQALSSKEEGDDPFMKIGKALDSIDNQQLVSESRAPVIKSKEHFNGSLVGSTSEPPCNSSASGQSNNDSEKNDAQIPAELIASCVATLLMVQTCTERQYPPADVAQILDSAVTSLSPCCPQNVPFYREIQMCMGRLKTQILGLVPT